MARKAANRRSAKAEIVPTSDQQKPVRPIVFWASMLLAGACVSIVVVLIIGNVPSADFGHIPRLIIVILLLLFVLASLATTEVIPWGSRSWMEWRRPKVLGNVVYLLLGAAGFIAGVSTIFNSPAAEQQTQLAIQASVGKLGKDNQKILSNQVAFSNALGAGHVSLIRQKIGGIWGEEGCEVTYEFSLKDRALTMLSRKNPSGIQPYKADFTVNDDSNRIGSRSERLSVIEAREEHGWFPGYSVTFTYRTNGVSESLIWDHRKMNVNAVELTRC